MKINKKLMIVTGLAAIVSLSVAATSSKPADVQYVNLKVLRKNISSRELQSIMTDDFQDGLGVTCSFCHANNKSGRGLDYASDAKAEKEISRSMMRMMLGINKKYFKLKHAGFSSNALIVTCNTCHKGNAFPDDGTDEK